MKAAVLREIGAPLRLEDVELDEPGLGRSVSASRRRRLPQRPALHDRRSEGESCLSL
jgi:hypothetical protein